MDRGAEHGNKHPPPAGTRLRIPLHTQPPPHPPSITPSPHPQSLCLQFVSGREDSAVILKHSSCLSPQSAASAVVSAESGQAGERVLRHGPAVGGRVGGEQYVIRCGPLLLFLCVSCELGRPFHNPFLDCTAFLPDIMVFNASRVWIAPVST